jgi:hypothetical protein
MITVQHDFLPFLRPFYISALALFIVWVLTFYANRDVLTSNTYRVYLYTSAVVVVLALSFGFATQSLPDYLKEEIPLAQSFSTLLGLVVLVYFVIFTRQVLPRITVDVFLRWYLVVFMMIVAVTIFYNFFYKITIKKPGFLLQLFLFIPCMLTDFIKYMIQETKGITYTVVVLILLEILLVALYFGLPVLLSNPSLSGQISLLEGMVFLDTQYTLGSSDLFHVQAPASQGSYFTQLTRLMAATTEDPLPIVFNQSYSISFWVYINPHSLTDPVPIFNYGGGKPALFFITDKNTGYFISMFSNINSDKHVYGITLPFQKWNYFVYSYINGTCELYINGELVYIDNLQGDTPTYDVNDIIVVGRDRGLYGSICNVCYFKNPLSQAAVVATYNLLSMQNPPIFITTTTDRSQSWYDYFQLGTWLLHDNRSSQRR